MKYHSKSNAIYDHANDLVAIVENTVWPDKLISRTEEIVNACNSHDELVKACTRIANHEYRSDRRHKGMVDIDEMRDLQRIAKQALAKARK